MSIDTPTPVDLNLDGCEPDARETLEGLLAFIGTRRPSLRQLWAAMDCVWDSFGADNMNPSDESLERFYSHPIWLLNGLFSEVHEQSVEHRERFSDWVMASKPHRVVDVGGGYGALARMIASKCPDASVEVLEPFPRPEALEAAEPFTNLQYVSELSGNYDVVVATDVFEHLKDPIGFLFEIGLRHDVGGQFLVANHFAPSIKCHLPRTFHLAETWRAFMRLAGYQKVQALMHARIFEKVEHRTLSPAVRAAEHVSTEAYRMGKRVPNLRWLHRGVARSMRALV